MVIFDSFEEIINVMSAKGINNYYIFYTYMTKNLLQQQQHSPK